MIKYNEKVIPYKCKNTENYWLLIQLIQYYGDEKYLQVNPGIIMIIIFNELKELVYKNYFTAFLNVLGLSMYVLMSHGRLLKILIPE